MIELNRIYNEDCLEGMKRIPDKSIDMVLSDLPYGVLNRNNKSAQWDNCIDFARLWEQYDRIIKDNCPIVLFGSGMFTAKLMMSHPDMWRYNLVWDKCKSSGFLNANRMPLRSHEDICVFYKKLPIYHPQMVKCAPHQRNHSNGERLTQDKNSCYGRFTGAQSRIADDKYPVSIIRIPSEHKNGHFFHPTQKPVALMEYLIRTYTDEGMVVLDNCIGSGTTAIAAIRSGRAYLGFEIETDYCDIAAIRIVNEIQNKNN